MSCPERHGPAAVWRSFAKDLPPGDRTGYLRRKGSIVMIDLEALMQEKERRSSTDATMAGMSMHPPNGGLKAPQAYRWNHLLRRDCERRTRECIRERQYVTSLLETLVSPLSGGTESCHRVTTNDLQGWQSTGLSEAKIGRSKNISV